MRPADIAIMVHEARKDERERCAKVAERAASSTSNGEGEVYIACAIAKKIRALKPR